MKQKIAKFMPCEASDIGAETASPRIADRHSTALGPFGFSPITTLALVLTLFAGPILYSQVSSTSDTKPYVAQLSAQTDDRDGYALVANRRESSGKEIAGLMHSPSDVSSVGDGFSFVADPAQHGIHVFDAEYQALRFLRLPKDPAAASPEAGPLPQRLDGSAGEFVSVLAQDALGQFVQAINRNGNTHPRMRLTDSNREDGMDYVDLSGDAAGRSYLLAIDSAGRPQIDIRDVQGTMLLHQDLRELFLPGCEQIRSQRITVGQKATPGDVDEGSAALPKLYLALGVDDSGCPNPDAPSPLPGDQRPPAFDGILELEFKDPQDAHAGLQIAGLQVGPVPDDLDVHQTPDGNNQLYWSEAGNLHSYGTASAVRWFGDTSPHAVPEAAPEPRFSFDARDTGQFAAAAASCPFAGAIWKESIERSSAHYLGNLWTGGLEQVWRIATDSSAENGDPMMDSNPVPILALLQPAPNDSFRVQDWSLNASNESQLHSIRQWKLCTETQIFDPFDEGPAPASYAHLPRDLARSAGKDFLIASQAIYRYGSEIRSELEYADPGAHFRAIASDRGQVAALDAARDSIHIFDTELSLRSTISITSTRQPTVAVDIAMTSDNVVLADRARSRIEIRQIEGRDRHGFASHLVPKRITAGPDGIFVLSESEWVLHYDLSGEILDAWPLPNVDSFASPDKENMLEGSAEERRLHWRSTDIALAADGRLFVSYVGIDAQADPASGVWVYAPQKTVATLGSGPPAESCLVRAAKNISEQELSPNERAHAWIDVHSACAAFNQAQHVVWLIDAAAGSAQPRRQVFDRLKLLAIEAMDGMSGGASKLALVVQQDDQLVNEDFSRELAEVRRQILQLTPVLDAEIPPVTRAAEARLANPPFPEDAARKLVIFGDERTLRQEGLAPVIQGLAEQEIQTLFVLITDGRLDQDLEQILDSMPASAQLWLDPDLHAMADLQSVLIERKWISQHFDRFDLLDQLNIDLDYVLGSQMPAGTWTEARRELHWEFLGSPMQTTPIPSPQTPTPNWTATSSPSPSATEVAGPSPTPIRTPDIPHRAGGDLESIVKSNEMRQFSYQFFGTRLGSFPSSDRLEFDYTDQLGHAQQLEIPIQNIVIAHPPSATPSPVPRAIFLPLLQSGCKPQLKSLDIVLVMDISSSMAELESAGEQSRSKLDIARDAASNFVDRLDLVAEKDRVAIIAFDAEARRMSPLTHARAQIGEALQALDAGRGTRIDAGLRLAEAELLLRGRPSANRVVILLTDGLQAGPVEEVYAAARKVKGSGARLVTIGLGPQIDVAMLQAVASRPDDHYASPQASDLDALYRAILDELECGEF